MNLLEIIKKFESEKRAVSHFNVANLEILKAVSHAAEKLNLPIIVGTSEGERSYFGVSQIAGLIKSYNTEHSNPPAGGGGYRLFLNADHTHSVDKVREAVMAGYDSVVFDSGKLPFEENIKKTKEAVDVAKSENPDVVVEGELGYIGVSSHIIKELPEGAVITAEDMPTGEQARQFVDETGVDLLAPAVGNIHGMFAEVPNPNLNINRIKEISEAVSVPLVLHGGSGITDEDMRLAISAGISVVHVSTELRVVWRSSIESALADNPNQIAPYKLMPFVLDALEKVIEQKVKLFYGLK